MLGSKNIIFLRRIADEVKQLDGSWMRAPIFVVFHAVSVVFSIFVNLPTKLMDLGILKCHPDFLRTNIGKWERFFRKIKSIFYVLKQKTFEELLITSAQPRSQGLCSLPPLSLRKDFSQRQWRQRRETLGTRLTSAPNRSHFAHALSFFSPV